MTNSVRKINLTSFRVKIRIWYRTRVLREPRCNMWTVIARLKSDLDNKIEYRKGIFPWFNSEQEVRDAIARYAIEIGIDLDDWVIDVYEGVGLMWVKENE